MRRFDFVEDFDREAGYPKIKPAEVKKKKRKVVPVDNLKKDILKLVKENKEIRPSVLVAQLCAKYKEIKVRLAVLDFLEKGRLILTSRYTLVKG